MVWHCHAAAWVEALLYTETLLSSAVEKQLCEEQKMLKTRLCEEQKILRTRLCKDWKIRANGTLWTRPDRASGSCASSLTGLPCFLPGTDEDAIIDTLTKLNISQRQQVLITYKSTIGRVGGLQRCVCGFTWEMQAFWGYTTWVK